MLNVHKIFYIINLKEQSRLDNFNFNSLDIFRHLCDIFSSKVNCGIQQNNNILVTLVKSKFISSVWMDISSFNFSELNN